MPKIAKYILWVGFPVYFSVESAQGKPKNHQPKEAKLSTNLPPFLVAEYSFLGDPLSHATLLGLTSAGMQNP